MSSQVYINCQRPVCTLASIKMAQTIKFKYYFDFASQPSRAMLIIFKLSKTPFESVPVAFRRREHLTEQFKNEVNRFQKTPCIVEGDFKLSESIAILRYLHSTGRIEDSLYPTELKLRARVDEYLQWQHLNIRVACGLYFLGVWRNPGITGIQPSPQKVKKLMRDMETSLNDIENLWLGRHKFIVSNSVTAADLFAACEIEQPKICGYDPTQGRPKMKAWLEAVRQEKNPFYDEAHAILNKYAAKYGAETAAKIGTKAKM